MNSFGVIYLLFATFRSESGVRLLHFFFSHRSRQLIFDTLHKRSWLFVKEMNEWWRENAERWVNERMRDSGSVCLDVNSYHQSRGCFSFISPLSKRRCRSKENCLPPPSPTRQSFQERQGTCIHLKSFRFQTVRPSVSHSLFCCSIAPEHIAVLNYFIYLSFNLLERSSYPFCISPIHELSHSKSISLHWGFQNVMTKWMFDGATL